MIKRKYIEELLNLISSSVMHNFIKTYGCNEIIIDLKETLNRCLENETEDSIFLRTFSIGKHNSFYIVTYMQSYCLGDRNTGLQVFDNAEGTDVISGTQRNIIIDGFLSRIYVRDYVYRSKRIDDAIALNKDCEITLYKNNGGQIDRYHSYIHDCAICHEFDDSIVDVKNDTVTRMKRELKHEKSNTN